MPRGIVDDDIWKRARAAAGTEKGSKYDNYWAVVSSIYKKMGGKYRKSEAIGRYESMQIVRKYNKLFEAITMFNNITLPSSRYKNFDPLLEQYQSKFKFVHRDKTKPLFYSILQYELEQVFEEGEWIIDRQDPYDSLKEGLEELPEILLDYTNSYKYNGIRVASKGSYTSRINIKESEDSKELSDLSSLYRTGGSNTGLSGSAERFSGYYSYQSLEFTAKYTFSKTPDFPIITVSGNIVYDFKNGDSLTYNANKSFFILDAKYL